MKEEEDVLTKTDMEIEYLIRISVMRLQWSYKCLKGYINEAMKSLEIRDTKKNRKNNLVDIDYFRYIHARNNDFVKTFDVKSERGDRLELAADLTCATGSVIKYKILDGIYVFKTDCRYNDIDWCGKKSYIDNALVIYKLFAGEIKVKLTNGVQLHLRQGDILNASGNYAISKYYSIGQNTKITGLICYYQKMIDAVKKMEWDNSFLEEFYHDKPVQNGIVYRGDVQIDTLIDNLNDAVCNDNKILIKAKALELLAVSSLSYKKYNYKKKTKCSETQLKIANEVKEFLDNNLDAYYTMPFLAQKFTISLSSLKSAFKAQYGLSPYQHHLNKRLAEAKRLLEESDLKITGIYSSIGFSCHSNFVKAFKKKYHCVPSHYRKNI